MELCTYVNAKGKQSKGNKKLLAALIVAKNGVFSFDAAKGIVLWFHSENPF